MEVLSFVYYFLLPHSLKQGEETGRRPLTMCLMQSSPKCMEAMLEMLMLNPQQDYMKYVEPRLFKFMATKSIVFYNFLDRSCRKFMFRIVAEQNVDRLYFSRRTQYVND